MPGAGYMPPVEDDGSYPWRSRGPSRGPSKSRKPKPKASAPKFDVKARKESGPVMSKPLAQAWEWAREHDRSLKAQDFTGTAVEVDCDDNSYFDIKDSFLVERVVGGEKWCIIFSEHHGIHIFAKDELLEIRQYDPYKRRRPKRKVT